MEHDLTEKQPHPVRSRFELAIGRMIDAWLTAGRISVTAVDVKLAREFLEQTGSKVEDGPEARMRLVNGEGDIEEITREAAVMIALRRLAMRR